MRFKLILRIEKEYFGNAIPLNYQYEQSAVIYRILSKSSEQYAAWLHDNGFQLGYKRFKLFTFSRLIVPQYRIDKERERLIIQSDTVEWYISFLPERSTERFIQGIFMSQSFEIGDSRSCVRFSVQNVEVMPALAYRKEMTFETMSPICLSTKDDNRQIKYFSPSDLKAEGNIKLGLMHKYEAFYEKQYAGSLNFAFQVLVNDPKPVLIRIKAGTAEETRIKGYMCRFRIGLPEVLMKLMYESGIGEKGSLGFGMVKLVMN
ncbi:hypothetical protein EZS27_035357 [termite gut metagenome]|uniref:CRISPR associated protein Cas6 C-terminal domain-containing protein n=1 Tax=termite gut metagenome TaxID=433724 RepID=A0A5J4PWE3_9ZZZZ